MRLFHLLSVAIAGATRPASGLFAPSALRSPLGATALAVLSLSAAACGENPAERTLPSIQLAMDETVEPIFEDAEMSLYEVRLGIQLPILAPTAEERAALDSQPMVPYGTAPWLRLEDARLQLSWTVTNLDDEPHNVEVLVDPWNEFAKYFPGLQVVDAEEGEYLPNLSGIDYLYSLDPVSAGAGSRRHGIFTFDDMDELARDFATAMNLIENPPPPLGGGDPAEEGDGTVTYVNHAFAFQNHSESDLLVKDWIPAVIPALTGFDIGLRTTEPAKIAIEVIAELVDTGSGKIQKDGQSEALLEAPTQVITIGSAAP